MTKTARETNWTFDSARGVWTCDRTKVFVIDEFDGVFYVESHAGGRACSSLDDAKAYVENALNI